MIAGGLRAAALALLLLPGNRPGTEEELHVDARSGSDESGTGMPDAPFRTLSKALAEAGGASRIRVGLGTYGAGEELPLVLTPGTELIGFGSGSCRLDAGGAAVAIRVESTGENTGDRAQLSGITITGAGTGVRVTGGGELLVTDLRLDGMDRGLVIENGSTTSRAVSARGLRTRACSTGMHVSGSGAFLIELSRAIFDACDVGLFLDAELGYENPTSHSLLIEDSRFQGCGEAGVRREGSSGRNLGTPYTFEGCEFEGNGIGLELRIPSADSRLLVRDCRFVENTYFGLAVAGREGDPEAHSLVEDSEFRWNGVGMQISGTQGLFEVRRSRIVDNLGNGAYCSNFLVNPSRVLFANNLIANNGASGIYGIADGERLQVRAIHNTVVFNRTSGIERKERHKGKGTFEVRGCILYGNGKDLAKISAEEVFGCLVGDGTAVGENGSLAAAPGFLDADRRDYRLAADSPCLDRGGDGTGLPLGATDLDGGARRVGPLDLGAFERQAESP